MHMLFLAVKYINVDNGTVRLWMVMSLSKDGFKSQAGFTELGCGTKRAVFHLEQVMMTSDDLNTQYTV